MNIQILATGSSGNSVFIDDKVLVDAGITKKKFLTYQIPVSKLQALVITHKHHDHMNLAFVRYLIKEGISAFFPSNVIAEITKEGKLDVTPYMATGQITLIQNESPFQIDNLTFIPYPQKHHDLVNYAFVVENTKERLLYATDLDTLEPSDMGTGLMSLGQFDTILLEGNYDEMYLRSYIEYMVSLIPNESDPANMSDEELEKWVRTNYRHLPDDIARNAWRAIQNRRHLSKQQARAYVATHLKPQGRYYEIHRSKQFYEEPVDWKAE